MRKILCLLSMLMVSRPVCAQQGPASIPSPNFIGTVTVWNGTEGLNLVPNSGLLDFDYIPASGSADARFRFFRHTNTTGARSLDITCGNSSSTETRFSSKGISFINGFSCGAGYQGGAFDKLGIGIDSPLYFVHIQNHNTATPLTVSDRLVFFDVPSGAQFDTTAGALQSVGGYFTTASSRVAGANTLTNIGAYFQAQSGQTNYAAEFDNAATAPILVTANGLGNGVTFGASANKLAQINDSANATGLEMNVGTPVLGTCTGGSLVSGSHNFAGEVTGNTSGSCIINFGAPNFTNTPFCFVNDETALIAVRVSARSNSSITVTGAGSGDAFQYFCIGRIGT